MKKITKMKMMKTTKKIQEVAGKLLGMVQVPSHKTTNRVLLVVQVIVLTLLLVQTTLEQGDLQDHQVILGLTLVIVAVQTLGVITAAVPVARDLVQDRDLDLLDMEEIPVEELTVAQRRMELG